MNAPSEKELLRREAAMAKAEADALQVWLEANGAPTSLVDGCRQAARDSVIFPIRRTGGQPDSPGHMIQP